MINRKQKIFYSRFKNDFSEFDDRSVPYNYQSDFVTEEDAKLREKYKTGYTKAAKDQYEDEKENIAYEYYYESPGLAEPQKKKDREEWKRKHKEAAEKRDRRLKEAEEVYQSKLKEKNDFDKKYEEKYGQLLRAEKDLNDYEYNYRINTRVADNLAEKFGDLDKEKKKKIVLGRKDLLDKYIKNDEFIQKKRELEDKSSDHPSRLKKAGRNISDTATGIKRQWEDSGVVYEAATDGRSLNKDTALVAASAAALGAGAYALHKHLKKKKKERELSNNKFITSKKNE